MDSIDKLFDGMDLDQIEIENEGFFPYYEVECYYDVHEYNDAGTDRTGRLIWEGATVSPINFINEVGDLDLKSFSNEIRRQTQLGIDHEDRVGPVYIVC